jgi:hypothetical protein
LRLHRSDSSIDSAIIALPIVPIGPVQTLA